MADDFQDSGVPLLRISNIQGKRVILEGCNFLSEDKVQSKWNHFKLKNKDYLISSSASTGMISEVTEESEGSVAYTGIIRLRPKDTIYRNYIPWILSSSLFSTQIDLMKTGSTIQHFGPLHLRMMSITVPPLNIQKQISDFLDKETTRIDTLIFKKQKQIELMREGRQSLIDMAIRSPKSKQVRLEHIAKRIFRPIGRISDKLYIPIGMYNRGRGVFHKPETVGEELGDSEFSWIKFNDVILSGQFSWEGAVGMADIQEDGCICSHRYAILNGDDQNINNSYLYSFFDTHYGNFLLNEHSRGAAGRNRPLNTNTLLKEKIPVPDMDLQIKIEKQIQLERKLKPVIQKSIDLLKEYRSSLVTNTVSGKIDISKYEVSK